MADGTTGKPESGARVSVHLTMGPTSIRMHEFAVSSDEAFGVVSVLDEVIAQVMKSWPRLVYPGQLEKIVRAVVTAQLERLMGATS